MVSGLQFRWSCGYILTDWTSTTSLISRRCSRNLDRTFSSNMILVEKMTTSGLAFIKATLSSMHSQLITATWAEYSLRLLPITLWWSLREEGQVRKGGQVHIYDSSCGVVILKYRWPLKTNLAPRNWPKFPKPTMSMVSRSCKLPVCFSLIVIVIKVWWWSASAIDGCSVFVVCLIGKLSRRHTLDSATLFGSTFLDQDI